MAAKETLRIIHTSDIHLGMDRHAGLARQAWRAVANVAAGLKGDALLIAGDLFDHNRVAEEEVDFFMAEVGLLAVPVVVLPGNHDCYNDTSVYRREQFKSVASNLHLITQPQGQLVSLQDMRLEVWGRAMVDHHPGFRPLKGISSRKSDGWLIALAHGYFHTDGDAERRSSPILARDIAASPCDYVALGHWDRFLDVSQGRVRACYCGTPLQPLSQNGLGQVAVVELDSRNGVRVQPLTLGGAPL